MRITRGSVNFCRNYGILPTIMAPAPALMPQANPLYDRPIAESQMIPESRKLGQVTSVRIFRSPVCGSLQQFCGQQFV